jgi:hypothetical protein
MKSKFKNSIPALFLSVLSLYSYSQAAIPKGKTQLIEFTNATAKFTVPEGKTWIIYSIFSDFVVGGAIKVNEYSKKNELIGGADVRIFLKDLNGSEKTNYIKNIYGTQLYRSTNTSAGISYPVIFPEKTAFSLIVLKGDLGDLELQNGSAYISFIEIDN